MTSPEVQPMSCDAARADRYRFKHPVADAPLSVLDNLSRKSNPADHCAQPPHSPTGQGTACWRPSQRDAPCTTTENGAMFGSAWVGS